MRKKSSFLVPNRLPKTKVKKMFKEVSDKKRVRKTVPKPPYEHRLKKILAEGASLHYSDEKRGQRHTPTFTEPINFSLSPVTDKQTRFTQFPFPF